MTAEPCGLGGLISSMVECNITLSMDKSIIDMIDTKGMTGILSPFNINKSLPRCQDYDVIKDTFDKRDLYLID